MSRQVLGPLVCLSLRRRVKALRIQVSTRSRGELGQYKGIYYGRVTAKPKFANNEWDYIDKLSLTAGAPTADSIATSSYNKLRHRTMGPYNVMKVRPNTILINEHRVRNVRILFIQLGSNL